jgi:glycyl-tRNA synthetase
LVKQGIQVNPLQRRMEITRQAEALAREVGGSGTPDQALLDEVNNLVEAPTALFGSFDAQHLQLPAEVLVSVMKKHQRYFPIQDQAGRLLPHFIIVRNGDRQHLDVVADGNEQVIRARFADAAFFIREDLHQPLHAFLPRLGTLTFQVKLGSMLDKTHRIEHLVERLLTHFNVQDEVEQMSTRRAAQLCKADLVTKMVVEMTSLQGIIGRYYALNSGEQQDVAQVLYEHYLPRYTGDAVPSTRPGLWVGLADRLDTLSGLFAAGLAPSGTKDPFAQRRAALGLVQVLIDWDLDFDLRRGIAWAAEGLDIPALSETQAACLDFIVGRLRSYLMDAGFRYDVVDAVLAAQQHNPAGAARAVRQLTNWVARSDWTTILPAYARCVRITRDQVETYTVDEAAFVEPVESELFQALISAEKSRSQPGSVDDFLACFVPLIPVINRYFEQVMVMVDDSRIRANRLGTLQRVGALATGAADLSLLEGF